MAFKNKERKKEYNRDWYAKNQEHAREYFRGYRKSMKSKVISAYGGKCVCCNENEEKFLTIDHINNDGAQHRKDNKITAGYGILSWLIKNNFPDNVQLLCWNCNCGRYQNDGICPHKKNKGTIKGVKKKK